MPQFAERQQDIKFKLNTRSLLFYPSSRSAISTFHLENESFLHQEGARDSHVLDAKALERLVKIERGVYSDMLTNFGWYIAVQALIKITNSTIAHLVRPDKKKEKKEIPMEFWKRVWRALWMFFGCSMGIVTCFACAIFTFLYFNWPTIQAMFPPVLK